MSLVEHIVSQLAEEGIEVTAEQLQAHFDSFEPPKPKAKTSAKTSPKAKAKSKAVPKTVDEDEVEEDTPAPKAKAAKSKVSKVAMPKAKTSAKAVAKVTAKAKKAVVDEEDIEVEEDTPAPKAKSSAKTAKAKAIPKAKSKPAETHTCGYTIKGKDGTRLCGANAKNEIDDTWFCGTEKSGHYKSALAAAVKAAPKSKVSKVAAKSKATNLISKTVHKKNRINVHEIVPGSNIWTEPESRIVFDKATMEGIGVLDEDNLTVLPLTDDAVRYLEAHNQKVGGKTKTAKSAKSSAKATSARSSTAPAKAKTTAKAKAKPKK